MNTVKAERNKVSLVGGEPFDFVLLKRFLWLDGKFEQDNTRKSSLTLIFFQLYMYIFFEFSKINYYWIV